MAGRAGLASTLVLNRIEALPTPTRTVRLLADSDGAPFTIVRVGLAVAAADGRDEIEADRRARHARPAGLATSTGPALAELVRVAIGVAIADSAYGIRDRGLPRCGSERAGQGCRALDDHALAGPTKRTGVDRRLGDPSDAPQVLRAGLCATAVALRVGGGLGGDQAGGVGGICPARGEARRGGPEERGKESGDGQEPTGAEAHGDPPFAHRAPPAVANDRMPSTASRAGQA